MPKKGVRHWIYGAFASKADAEKEHKRRKGSFVLARKVKGHTRYLVLKERSQ